jgi:hypothetical protein
MTGEIVFMAALAVFAVAIIWKSVKKKTKKSCCE